MIRRDHARVLAAVLASLIASTPAGAVSLYSGVALLKTRPTPAPLTGCCGIRPSISAVPEVPRVDVAQIPSLPTAAIPKAVEPIVPVQQIPQSALGQVQSAAENVAKAAQPGDGNAQAALTSTFDGGGLGANVDEQDVAFDPSLVEAAQRLYHPNLKPGETGAVAVGIAPRPLGAPVDDAELQARMQLSPLTNAEREETVKKLFMKAGAQASEIIAQPAGRGKNNYYVVKKGKTDRVIVVGAHHDKVSEGAGTIDNWTGATMMINLYQAMRDVDTDATYVFIAFAREEEGLIGSEAYVNSLSKAQRSKIDAMLNLDTLGVDGTFSWKNNSTRAMLDRIKQVAAAEKRDLVEAYLNGGDADSSTFRQANIPAMTVFGASQDVIFDIIHSSRDNMSAFNLPHYKNAYLLSLALLKALNATPLGKPGRV